MVLHVASSSLLISSPLAEISNSNWRSDLSRICRAGGSERNGRGFIKSGRGSQWSIWYSHALFYAEHATIYKLYCFWVILVAYSPEITAMGAVDRCSWETVVLIATALAGVCSSYPLFSTSQWYEAGLRILGHRSTLGSYGVGLSWISWTTGWFWFYRLSWSFQSFFF